MFDLLDKIVSDFFNDGIFKNTECKVKKEKIKKKSEKVKSFPKSKIYEYYDPCWLFIMNQPGEYVEYEEIK